jgi:predicted membrane protein
MNFLIFALLIAAPGCLLAHRLLRERSRFVVAALGFPLGLVGLLSAANLALRLGLSLGASLALTALAFVVVSAIVIRKRPSPGFIADELNPLTSVPYRSILQLVSVPVSG